MHGMYRSVTGDEWLTKEGAAELLPVAARLAEDVHEGQTYGGMPYMYHVYGVTSRMDTDELKVIALLHDVIEDSEMTFKGLCVRFPKYIAEAVVALTHRKRHPSYGDYIDGLCTPNSRAHYLARLVKVEDIMFNLSHNPKKSKRPKYHYALERLRRANLNYQTGGGAW